VSTPYQGGGLPQQDLGYGESGASTYTPPAADGYDYGNTAQPMTEEGHPNVEGTSVGQLIGDVTRDLSTLMRQELELAKAELRADANKATEEVKAQAGKAGKGAGMLAGAGVAGLMLAVFLSCALWWALENVMDAGLAALIVAVLWGVIGAIAFSMGKKKLQQVNPKPERTVDTLSDVPSALKPN
jgi:hypothetical protein